MKADGDDVDYKNSYFFISYMIYFPLVFIQFILHCFADKTPLYTEYPTVKVNIKGRFLALIAGKIHQKSPAAQISYIAEITDSAMRLFSYSEKIT